MISIGVGNLGEPLMVEPLKTRIKVFVKLTGIIFP